jgi:hypothetical protein
MIETGMNVPLRIESPGVFSAVLVAYPYLKLKVLCAAKLNKKLIQQINFKNIL